MARGEARQRGVDRLPEEVEVAEDRDGRRTRRFMLAIDLAAATATKEDVERRGDEEGEDGVWSPDRRRPSPEIEKMNSF